MRYNGFTAFGDIIYDNGKSNHNTQHSDIYFGEEIGFVKFSYFF